MLNQDHDANPAQSWARCASAMADASLAFAVEATKTTMSLWGGAPAPSASTQAEPAATPERKLKPERVRQPVVQVTERAPSWYRAPYRSPFDPMFWLQPDTSRSLSAPTAVGFPALPAPFALPGLSVPFMSAQPAQAGQAMMAAMFANPLSNPMLSGSMFNNPLFSNPMLTSSMFSHPMFSASMFPGAIFPGATLPSVMSPSLMSPSMLSGGPSNPFAAMTPWLMEAWQPMLSSWLAMMPQMAFPMPSLSPTPSRSSPAAMDPAGASAYRSMGGFAVAQVFMDPANTSSGRVAPAAQTNPWIDLMFPWLRR